MSETESMWDKEKQEFHQLAVETVRRVVFRRYGPIEHTLMSYPSLELLNQRTPIVDDELIGRKKVQMYNIAENNMPRKAHLFYTVKREANGSLSCFTLSSIDFYDTCTPGHVHVELFPENKEA